MSATSTPAGTSDASRARIDPRGPRFAATLTTVLLALVLLSAPSPVGLALLAAQTHFFAVGAVAGVQHTPYAWLFKDLVRPRLGPPADLEDAAPPRFAQTVGLAFAVVGLVGYATGLTLLGSIAIGLALAAAFLNAAFGFCLGCEMYLLVRRLAPANRTQNDSNRAGRNPVAAER
jgi:hypothetical protein